MIPKVVAWTFNIGLYLAEQFLKYPVERLFIIYLLLAYMMNCTLEFYFADTISFIILSVNKD